MSKLIVAFVTFVVLSIDSTNGQIKDYCSTKLCQNGRHSACNITGKFSSICPDNIKVVKLNKLDKILVVDKHNYYRSKIAGGDQPLYPGSKEKFPMASKMNALIYNEEHSFLSVLQLKTCLSHDECHNVVRNNGSVFSGQNIFTEFHGGEFKKNGEYISEAIDLWYNEYQVTTLDVIDKLYFPKDYVVGHFTQVIHDKNTEVGCSMVQWTENGGKEKNVKVTCNYQKAAYLGQPVYKIGDAGADCNKLDDEYGILCI
ncbi:unnamed protein product [Diamesa tonsa]